MTTDASDSDGPRLPRSRDRHSSRPAPRGISPLLGLSLVVGLALLAFLQALVLAPQLYRNRRPAPDRADEGVRFPDREVRVFTGEGRAGLLLKTPLDLPEADEDQAAQLDAWLFPGGDRHRYWMLHLFSKGEEPVRIDCADPPLLLQGKSGDRWHPVDLAAALRERADSLPPWLRVWLRLHLPATGSITLRPGGSRQLLLAYPEAASPAAVEAARVGETILTAEVLRKDVLDGELDRRDDDGRSEAP